MIDKLNRFFETIQETPIELYSEFGLQHELAIFLKSNFPNLRVRLEYPTPRIFNPLPHFIKKEIGQLTKKYKMVNILCQKNYNSYKNYL